LLGCIAAGLTSLQVHTGAFEADKLNSVPPGQQGEFKRFQESIADYGVEFVRPFFDAIIDGRETQTQWSEDRPYFSDFLFPHFFEIAKSHEALLNGKVYISSHPFKRRKVSQGSYLRFIIETHLSEMYVLKERLVTFATVFKRKFKNDPLLKSEVRAKCDELVDLVEQALGRAVRVRGYHVHNARLEDERLKQLDLLELVVKYGKPENIEALRAHSKNLGVRLRRTFRNEIIQNNARIQDLLDAYFGKLSPYVFDERTGRLIVPANPRPEEPLTGPTHSRRSR
jgi:hypothetical protein